MNYIRPSSLLSKYLLTVPKSQAIVSSIHIFRRNMSFQQNDDRLDTRMDSGKSQEAQHDLEGFVKQTVAPDHIRPPPDITTNPIPTTPSPPNPNSPNISALPPTSTTGPTSAPHSPKQHPSAKSNPKSKSSAKAKSSVNTTANAFDPSKYTTRRIALKFAYLGAGYNGFEWHARNRTALPTVEEALWIALVRTRLIFPPSLRDRGLLLPDVGAQLERLAARERGVAVGVGGGAGEGEEDDGEDGGGGGVPVDWEGCRYSKCGRTDRGVSAFGQVIGITVRSSRPLEDKVHDEQGQRESGEAAATASVSASDDGNIDTTTNDVNQNKGWDPVKDEIQYISLLNRVLPSTIRVLAWCPFPADNFDARFSCKEREYRYFFTSPAFLPVPGRSENSELDIQAMEDAAQHFIGTHDFRNFCKLDGSKQLTEFLRKINSFSIEIISELPDPIFSHCKIKVYAFKILGSAFLWHQVRCMVAILFLVGQRLEQPSIVKELLNIDKCSSRPLYEMASDAPLVLWDCKFSATHGKVTADPSSSLSSSSSLNRPHYDRGEGDDEINWIYAGDDNLLGKNKWSTSGIMEGLWSSWRSYKMQELLASQLMQIVANGGESPNQTPELKETSTKVFQGDDSAAGRGVYQPILQRPRQEPIDIINSRWSGRKKR